MKSNFLVMLTPAIYSTLRIDVVRGIEIMADLLEQPFDENEPGIFADLEEVWRFDASEI